MVKKLKSDKGDVWVTTIQKLQNVMRRYPKGTKEYEKLHILRPVLVVDECHRAVSPMAQHLLNQFLKAYREFDNAYSDIQVYSPYQVRERQQSYGIDASAIEAYSGKFNNIKEEFKKEDDRENLEVNLAIDYDLRCYHVDQIDEDYILRLMEATRSDWNAFGKTIRTIRRTS